MAVFDVHVIPEWLSSEANLLADCLSRGTFDPFSHQGKKFLRAQAQWKASPDTYLRPVDYDDWKLSPEIFKQLDLAYSPFHVDACSDVYGANSQLDIW